MDKLNVSRQRNYLLYHRAHRFICSIFVLILINSLIACSHSSTQENVKLTRLELFTPLIHLAISTKVQLIATGFFSNHSQENYADKVEWSSSDTNVATVSSTGLVATKSAGRVNITIKYQDFEKTIPLLVNNTALQQLTLSSSTTALITGQTIPLVASGLYDDGSQQNLNDTVTWSSTEPSVATVNGNQITAVANGNTTIVARVGSKTATIDISVSSPTLESITLGYTQSSALVGQTIPLTASGMYNDKKAYDISQMVQWKVNDSSIASIDGVHINFLRTGSVTLTASYGTKSTSFVFTVVDTSVKQIIIQSPDGVVTNGSNIQLQATGVLATGEKIDVTQTVDWSIDKTDSFVSNSTNNKGQVAIGSDSSVTVTATLGDISGTIILKPETATLNSIEINPVQLTLATSTKASFHAIGIYSDNSSKDISNNVFWSTADTNIVSISNGQYNKGSVSALNAGSTTLSATLGGVSGSSTVTVTNSSLEKLTVSNNVTELIPGQSINLLASGLFSDGSQQNLDTTVTWSSSDTSVAIMEGNQLTAIANGSTIITASSGSKSVSITVTVNSPSLSSIGLDYTQSTVVVGQTLPLTASGIFNDQSSHDISQLVQWQVSDSSIASIDGANINFLKTGSVILTASYHTLTTNLTFTVVDTGVTQIIIQPPTGIVTNGSNIQLQAMGILASGEKIDITEGVDWSTNTNESNVSNATGSKGQVSIGSYTSVTITATLGNISGTITLNPESATLQSIEVSPVQLTLAKSTKAYLHAFGVYSDNSFKDITNNVFWSSADSSLVSVNNNQGSVGEISALDTGSTTITATMAGISGVASITVNNDSLTSLNLTTDDNSSSVAAGFSKSLNLIGRFQSGSTQNLNMEATWQSFTPNICQIDNKPSGIVIVHAIAKGNCQINASVQDKSTSLVIQVTDVTLSSLNISPSSFELPIGISSTFTITGTFSDNTQTDITRDVAFKTSSNIVSIDNSNARATGISPGTATVTVYYGNISSTVDVTVTSAALTSISLSTTTSDYYKGRKILLKANGIFSDNSSRDISDQVLWSSNDTSIGTIENGNNYGILTLKSGGTVTISAKLNGVSKDLPLTVIDAPNTATSISVNNSLNVILNDNTEQSVLTIKLLPEGGVNGQIADGTNVELTVYSSDGTVVGSMQTLQTTAGVASYNFKTANKGTYVAIAHIPNSNITRVTSIYATDDLSEVIAKARTFSATFTSDGKIKSGSILGFSVINLSNRVFTIEGFVILDNNVEVYNSKTGTPLNLSDMKLSAGERVDLVYQTKQDRPNNFAAALYLTDDLQGSSVTSGRLTIVQSYVLAAPQ